MVAFASLFSGGGGAETGTIVGNSVPPLLMQKIIEATL